MFALNLIENSLRLFLYANGKLGLNPIRTGLFPTLKTIGYFKSDEVET